jgi:hypothetical protein
MTSTLDRYRKPKILIVPQDPKLHGNTTATTINSSSTTSSCSIRSSHPHPNERRLRDEMTGGNSMEWG